MEFDLPRLFSIVLEELITLGVANLRPFSISQFIYRDFGQNCHTFPDKSLVEQLI